MKKNYLLTPGPTQIPPSVLLSMAQPIIHHRTAEFEKIFSSVRQALKRVYQTQQDVLVLCSSGTGAMEASVTNLLSPGDQVLTINGGKFGERWTKLCQTYGASVEEIKVEWGKAVDIQTVASKLAANPQIKAVYATYSETSTGVLHDVKALAKLTAERPNTVLVVDAITALGVIEVPMDEWGIDVLITGSQKALMMPPGLAFIALSQKAWKMAEGAKMPRFYFDLKREKKNQEVFQTAFTPAISLIIGLGEALAMMEAEGLEKVYQRHRLLAEATRQASKALGLKMLAPDSPSPALTAVFVPEGIEGKKLEKLLSGKYGVTIIGGQDHLKGKIIRIAHIGYVGTFDVITAISALEMALTDLGYKVELGKGVGAAQKVLMNLE